MNTTQSPVIPRNNSTLHDSSTPTPWVIPGSTSELSKKLSHRFDAYRSYFEKKTQVLLALIDTDAEKASSGCEKTHGKDEAVSCKSSQDVVSDFEFIDIDESDRNQNDAVTEILFDEEESEYMFSMSP
jgi:hypothetical protein